MRRTIVVGWRVFDRAAARILRVRVPAETGGETDSVSTARNRGSRHKRRIRGASSFRRLRATPAAQSAWTSRSRLHMCRRGKRGRVSGGGAHAKCSATFCHYVCQGGYVFIGGSLLVCLFY